MMLKKLVVLSLLWSLSFLQASEPLKVVTTFSILSDFVSSIGGDGVTVETIVSFNADPHTYQPTPADAIACAQADLIFINGLTFEGWIDRLIAASGYEGDIITVSRTVTPRLLTTQGQPAIDPHAWHDVQNAILYVQVITDALCKAIPSRTEILQARRSALIQRLKDLDLWVKSQLAQIPEEDRLVVTTHDAFWYYGDAYGITFLSPVGISTDAQPSAAAIAGLIRQIRSQHIKAIFIENLSSRKLIDQIAQEAGVPIEGTLYADSLSPSDGPASSYITMIQENTRQIVEALSR